MQGPIWLEGGLFRKQGLRFTLPRRVILDTLCKTKGHLSAEDIYLRIHDSYPQIGLATVYRTLELLSKMGLICKFDFGDGCSRYELARARDEEHHHHLVCIKCGKITDYSDFVEEETRLIREIEKALSRKYDFQINSHQLHFYGVCKDCQQGNNSHRAKQERR